MMSMMARKSGRGSIKWQARSLRLLATVRTIETTSTVQKASGYNWRALVETDINRYKRVIGDTLRSRTDARRATEVGIAIRAPNRMLKLGRPASVRIAEATEAYGIAVSPAGSMLGWTAPRHRVPELALSVSRTGAVYEPV